MKPKCRGGSDVDTHGLGSISVLHICTWVIHLCSAAQHWGETPRAQNTKSSSENSQSLSFCAQSVRVQWEQQGRGFKAARVPQLQTESSQEVSLCPCHGFGALPQCPLLLLSVTRLRACWTFAVICWAPALSGTELETEQEEWQTLLGLRACTQNSRGRKKRGRVRVLIIKWRCQG